jgi:hypothetical protein
MLITPVQTVIMLVFSVRRSVPPRTMPSIMTPRQIGYSKMGKFSTILVYRFVSSTRPAIQKAASVFSSMITSFQGIRYSKTISGRSGLRIRKKRMMSGKNFCLQSIRKSWSYRVEHSSALAMGRQPRLLQRKRTIHTSQIDFFCFLTIKLKHQLSTGPPLWGAPDRDFAFYSLG